MRSVLAVLAAAGTWLERRTRADYRTRVAFRSQQARAQAPGTTITQGAHQ